MLVQHKLQSINAVRYGTVSASKSVEEAVYTFSTLFSHHAKSHVPLLEPRNDTFLMHMHFREHGRFREVLSIERHKLSDVTLCEGGYIKMCYWQ